MMFDLAKALDIRDEKSSNTLC